MRLNGVVSSGLGRAHVFMAQSHYQDQFREVLGNTAWPGTLNLNVSGDSLSKSIALRNKAGLDTLELDEEIISNSKKIDVSRFENIRIRGFLREGVSFGGATAYKIKIETPNQDIDAAILIPDLTRHVDVVEIIATKFLRESMNLKDGDQITVELS